MRPRTIDLRWTLVRLKSEWIYGRICLRRWWVRQVALGEQRLHILWPQGCRRCLDCGRWQRLVGLAVGRHDTCWDT